MLDSLTTKSTQYLDSVAQSSMFYKDMVGALDSTTITNGAANFGLVSRYKRTKDVKYVMLEAPLFTDLSEMEQYIPSVVKLHVKLHPTIDDFSFISGVTTEFYQVDINYLSLRCKFIDPSAAVAILHAKILEMRLALLNYTKSVLKSFTVSKGVQT